MNKQEDNNRSIEEKIAIVKRMNLPIESERLLISAHCINEKPNNINPLLDRYPLDLTNNAGIFVKDMIIAIVNELKMRAGLQDIFGGYVLLESPINSFSNIGLTSTVGMNIEYIKNQIDEGNKIILGYIAIPIDDGDYLLENQSINDWNFQERYLDPLLDYGTVPVGSIGMGSVGRKGESGRLRTLKFNMDVNSFIR